jgi:choline dehydrogenase-like flavoprotein
MLADARLLPASVTIETEVCIIGSGAAGITLARELAQQNIDICLLESGSEELPTQDLKSLGDVEIDGDFVQVTSDNRNRKFGGNASYWGINFPDNRRVGLRIVPLAEVDFERRDWVPYSGWPFNRDHLVPYYERAQAVFDAGPFAHYNVEEWETAETPRLMPNSDRITTRMFQFGARDLFTTTYRNELADADNVTTYLHANVVELETDDQGKTVTRVRVACLDGKQFWVSAKIVVLAAGTIENTHLLLLSNQANPAGLGNHHDLLGRFFMDHPLVAGGFIYPKNPAIFNKTALYDLRYVRNTSIMGSLTLTDAAVRREQRLNAVAWIFPRVKRLNSPAISSFKALLSSRRFEHGLSGMVRHVGNVVGNIGDFVDSVRDTALFVLSGYGVQG